jgi:oxepin-CoA hydrolase/3-oxo-5,6-dehydrosuberyl-CoA semialdehyde dehydrogenase
LQVGHSLLTHRRTVTEADIVAFGGISGDYFYMNFDDEAAKASPFGKPIAHGYFVLSPSLLRGWRSCLRWLPHTVSWPAA